MKSYRCLLSLIIATLSINVAVAQQPFEPTDEHKVLKQDVGTWSAKGKMWMPGTPDPTEFDGTEVNRMIGGMWVVSDFEGSFFGQPFTGHSTMGYDMVTKKYTGNWMDSMSPHISKMSGTYDAATKTMTLKSESINPENGKPMKGKNVVVYKDANTRQMTMYYENPEKPSEMIKAMEMVYTRKNDKESGSK